MLKTEKYYSIGDIIKKLQSTSFKLKPNFEVLTPINNVKALQNIPLIVIIGEEHTTDENKKSYYIKDLEKLNEISKVLEINNLLLEGLAKGKESEIKNTVLNGEVELIKHLSQNKNYNIFGVEDLEIQIKILELGFLIYYSDYLKLINESFGNLLKNENFKVEIFKSFEKIFKYVLSNKLSSATTEIKFSMQLYVSMQQTKIDYNDVFKKIEICYSNFLIHLNGLCIKVNNLNDLNSISMSIIKKYGFNFDLDKKKLDQIHFKYISEIRDGIFTKNILETIKEKNLSKTIFICGISHMQPVSKLIQINCEKFLGTKVNIVLIDIT